MTTLCQVTRLQITEYLETSVRLDRFSGHKSLAKRKYMSFILFIFLERVHGSQLYTKVYDGNSIRRPGGPQFPAKQTKQHTPVKLGARVVTNQRRGRTCSPPPQPVHSVRPCAVKQLGHSGNHGTEPTPTSRANGAPRNLPPRFTRQTRNGKNGQTPRIK